MDIESGHSHEGPLWLRSRSCEAGGCIEIATIGGYIGIRDSKQKNGPILMFDQEEWRAFERGMAAGDFRSIGQP